MAEMAWQFYSLEYAIAPAMWYESDNLLEQLFSVNLFRWIADENNQ